MIYQGLKGYPVNEIVVHCSATRLSWMGNNRTSEKVAEIRRWHTEDRGWNDIGYHLIIDRDGTVAKGRPFTVIGAGVEGHNRGVIHICLIGGWGSSVTSRFAANYSRAQGISLAAEIQALASQLKKPLVRGHNDYSNTKACPGFQVHEWLAEWPSIHSLIAWSSLTPE